MTERSGRERLPREIWVLVAAGFVIALGFGLIAPIIPQYAASFNVSLALASSVVSIFAFSRLAFAPLSGRIVDRFGSRTAYVVGTTLVGVTTGAMAVATQFWHLLALRGIAGIGSTMFTVSAMGLIVRLAPSHMRGRASSLYATSFLVGNILGPVVGAALTVLGMRLPFLIYGISVLVAAAIVYFLLDAQTIYSAEHTNSAPPMGFREAIAHPSFQSNLVSGFANGWSNIGARVAILPLFAAATFHQGGAVAGIALATFAGGNATAQLFAGRLSDTVGRKPLILAGLAVNSAFTGALGFSHAPWSLLALSALAGFGAGLLNPSQQAVMADIIGRERSAGRILANFQMSQDLGAILGPVAVGFLADSYGYPASFLACGLLTAVALIVWTVRGRETREV